MTRRAAVLPLVVAALIVLTAPAAATAQTTYTVNTPADGPPSGGCSTAPGGCTLRGAIGATVAGDIVSVPPGTYVLTLGELAIDNSMSILGAGARTTVIDANGTRRVAEISSDGTQAAISGVTATGGNGGSSQTGQTGPGGAFLVRPFTRLTLTNATVSGNTSNGDGGGIYNAGTLVLSGTTVAGNQAVSAFAPSRGGGIFQAFADNPPGFTAIVASTVSGNSASSGGGIYAIGNLALDRTTIAANTAASGSGLFRAGGATQVNNTIVTAATGTACTGDTTLITGTYNLSDDTSCTFTDTGDRQNADPLVGALQNNGGPTNTHALGAASPAIGGANPGTCSGTDQRGVARPQQGTCDIGAFEYVPPPQPPTPNDLPPPVAGKLVNATPKRGTVKIKRPGRKHFSLLRGPQQIPVGTIVDTRKGRVSIVAAANKTGGTAAADFYDGVFKLLQSKGARPITTLELVEKLNCPRRGQASAAAKKKKRKLWGDGTGRFRTKGSYSAATVRGTKWLVEDRCASTLTRVARGSVSVRDFVKHKTVIVRTGKRYIARRK